MDDDEDFAFLSPKKLLVSPNFLKKRPELEMVKKSQASEFIKFRLGEKLDEVADLFFANLKVVSPTLFTKDGRTSKDNKLVTPRNVKF